MEVGKIAAWKKREGEAFSAGEVIAEIETDKAVVDFEMQDDGFLAKILVSDDSDDLEVGSVLALTVEDEADIAAVLKMKLDDVMSNEELEINETTENQNVTNEVDKIGLVDSAVPNSIDNANVFVMPSASLMIENKNLDVNSIAGTGRDGRITKGDVIMAIKNGSARPASARTVATSDSKGASKQLNNTVASSTHSQQKSAESSVEKPVVPLTPKLYKRSESHATYTDTKPSGMRKVIASRLTDSKANVPHFYSIMDCELDNLLSFRKSLKSQTSISISVNDLVIRAAGLALRDVPEANARLCSEGKDIIENPSVDISVAVATEGGLITPIVTEVDKRGLSCIGNTVRELAGRARQGKLKPDEYQGGTFTISNLGMFGIKEFTAVINSPHSCILAVGGGIPSLKPKYCDVLKKEVPKKSTVLSVQLSADRRVVPDFVAGQFLQAFKQYIENPMLLSV